MYKHFELKMLLNCFNFNRNMKRHTVHRGSDFSLHPPDADQIYIIIIF